MVPILEDDDFDAMLTQDELHSIAGGRFKRPLQPPITVFYDDGVSVWTSDPASTNVHPVIK